MKEVFNNVVSVMKMIAYDCLEEGMIFIDATLGNGNDFIFLKKMVGDLGKGYGFDIQNDAIENSKEKIMQEGLEKNSLIIRDGHENIEKYVVEEVDFCVYNLGYLPKGDHSIITKKNTTIESLKQVLKSLKKGGKIVISSYIGHDGGIEEFESLIDFVSRLDQKYYNVAKIEFINQKNNPPRNIIIEKRKFK